MASNVMNPSLLTENELHEEYLVRGIKSRGAKGLQQLVSFLNGEASGVKLPPGPLPTLNSSVETKLIEDLFKNFASLMKEYSDSNDNSLVYTLMTKYLHIYGRVSRLAQVAGKREAVVALVTRLSNMKKHFDILSAAIRMMGDVQRSPTPQGPPVSEVEENVSQIFVSPAKSAIVTQVCLNSDAVVASGISGNPLYTSAPSMSGYANLSYGNVGDNDVFFFDARSLYGAASRIPTNRFSLPAQTTVPHSAVTSIPDFSADQRWGFSSVPNQNLNFNAANGTDKFKAVPRAFQRGGIRFSAPSQPISSAFVQNNSVPHQYDFPASPQPLSSHHSQFGASNFTVPPQQSYSADVPCGSPLATGYQNAAQFQGSQFKNNQQNAPSKSGPVLSDLSLFQQGGAARFQNPKSCRASCTNNQPSVSQQSQNSVPRSSVPPQSAFAMPQQSGNFDVRNPHGNQPQDGRMSYTHQMAKWNLRFHGNDKDIWVDDFLFRAETLARSANINLNTLPLGMHFLLHDDAQD